MMSHRPPTIRDVAARAGVSINTVSRALNGKPDVSAETRALVQAVAEQMDYRPNAQARSLVERNTRTLGLVVTDCTDPYYATLIRAIDAVASSHGYALLLVTSNESVSKETQALSLLRERRVDGILLTAVDVEAPHVRHLTETGLPIVLVSRRPSGFTGNFVGNDNVAGERLAVRHLLALGHRRIACVTRTGTASTAREQQRTLQQELEQAGLAYGPQLICTVEPSFEGGQDAARWLAGLVPRPTGVVVYNDVQAIGLMRAARALGIQVPADLSVVGHDDIAFAALVEPPLTTVAQPIPDIGRLAAEMLIQLLQGNAPEPPDRLLPPRLVVRSSTAPA